MPRSRIAFSRSLRADGFAVVFLAPVFSPDFSPRQGMQRGEHDVLGVHFEKVSQRCAILAAPEAVRAERHQLARNPLRDTLRQHLHVIRCRNKRAGRALQCLGDVRHFAFCVGCSMFQRAQSFASR